MTRPGKRFAKRISVPVTPALADFVAEIAEKDGTSEAQVMRALAMKGREVLVVEVLGRKKGK